MKRKKWLAINVAWIDWKAKYVAKAKLFQQLFDVVNETAFDDFTLELTGTVSDVNKFHELESRFPYWKVSFVKNRGEKKKVEIELSKNFKDMKGTLLEEVDFEDKIEDEIYEQMRRNGYFT